MRAATARNKYEQLTARSLDRYIVACLLLDSALILISLATAELLRATLPFGVDLGDLQYLNWLVYALALGCWLASSFHFRVYEWRWTVTWRREFGRIMAASAGFALLFAAALYLSFRDIPRLLFAYYTPLVLLTVLASHVIVRNAPTLLPGRKPMVRIGIVGTGRVARSLGDRLTDRSQSWPPTTVVGYITTPGSAPGAAKQDCLGPSSAIAQIIQREHLTTILLALTPNEHSTALELSKQLVQLGVDVRLLPDVLDLASARASIEYVEGLPLLGLRDPALTLPSRLLKYSFDRIASVLGLIFLSPILLLIAVLIKLDSAGPIIYRSRRVGEGGGEFDMLKFRTMQETADQHLHDVLTDDELAHGIYKKPDDPRVTRLGRFLRRTSLDELPQFFNVLRGEMSIVGPRPELPFIAAQYQGWQHKRTEIRPGLTGWWQVNGRSARPLHQNTDFDIYYLENYSFWLDLRILLRTVSAVLRGEGAY